MRGEEGEGSEGSEGSEGGGVDLELDYGELEVGVKGEVGGRREGVSKIEEVDQMIYDDIEGGTVVGGRDWGEI